MTSDRRDEFRRPIDGEDALARESIRTGQFGSAGAGLGSESATRAFGSSAKVGAIGERRFQQALESMGITREYSVWYSLSIPDDPSGRRGRITSDVDLAVANGNRVVLVDVKRWSAYGTYWTIPFLNLPMKGLKPMIHERTGEWRLSKNMHMALDKYRAALPGCRVSALVVFVPTSKKGATPTVIGFTWPGGIKSYLPNDAARRIRRELGQPEKVDARIVTLLGKMLRGR